MGTVVMKDCSGDLVMQQFAVVVNQRNVRNIVIHIPENSHVQRRQREFKVGGRSAEMGGVWAS